MSLYVFDTSQAIELMQNCAEVGYARCVRDRQTKQREDDISQRTAYAEFGEAWVKNAVKNGWVKGTRRGKTEKSTIFYSRFELTTIRKAQQLHRLLRAMQIQINE